MGKETCSPGKLQKETLPLSEHEEVMPKTFSRRVIVRELSGTGVEQRTGQTEEDLGKDYREKFNTQKGRTEKRGKQKCVFSAVLRLPLYQALS